MTIGLAARALCIVSCGVLIHCTTDDGVSAPSRTAEELRDAAASVTGALVGSSLPEAPNLKQYVRDRVALRQLGKAMFWDEQLGSDGQACASCHFHAGADNRSINQVNPGFNAGDQGFGASALNVPLGPNYQLTHADFPFHKLADVDDRRSTVMRDTNDVVSSQGVLNAAFRRATAVGEALWPFDIGTPLASMFVDAGAMVRNVEPRNTPTSINAALNHRNFWDGRARSEFNGANPLGSLEPTKIIKVAGKPKKPVFVQIRISSSSAAGQAVGPPLNGLEMSFHGRDFPQLGRKLLGARPLARQEIAPTDSVLGGVTFTTYAALIEKAFEPTWWDAAPGWVVDLSGAGPSLVKLASNAAPGPRQYTVKEYNFALFVGLALQEYERQLISSDTPFDRFMSGALDELSEQQREGLDLFLGRGKCVNCHGGRELTNASLANVGGFQIIERMIMGDNRVAVYDNGFYNIGVRPTAEDLGVGAQIGSRNRPLSNSRLYQECVRDALATSQTSLAAANSSCDVPRIQAKPEDALTLLARASELAEHPSTIAGLVAEAYALLESAAPDLVQLACKLARNEDLGCYAEGVLDLLAVSSQHPEVVALLRQAESLLPDQTRPRSGSHLLGPPLRPDERVAVDGAFKTPGLRNVELTAPYFHNGGVATLRQVVEFYNRGGDFAIENRRDLDPDIQPLGLSESEKDALVAFLESLTDDRLRFDKAPFDHPSLDVPNGGKVGASYLRDFGDGLALTRDDRVYLPAVGAAGCMPGCGGGLGTPGTPFANFLQPLTP